MCGVTEEDLTVQVNEFVTRVRDRVQLLFVRAYMLRLSTLLLIKFDESAWSDHIRHKIKIAVDEFSVI